jgi:hypothetical protein
VFGCLSELLWFFGWVAGLKKAPGFEVESTSIHPSSSTWKKKMMEERRKEEDEWQ